MLSTNYPLSLDHHKELKETLGGSWLAQLIEHATLDLQVVSLSPTFGMEPTRKKNTPECHEDKVVPSTWHHLGKKKCGCSMCTKIRVHIWRAADAPCHFFFLIWVGNYAFLCPLTQIHLETLLTARVTTAGTEKESTYYGLKYTLIVNIAIWDWNTNVWRGCLDIIIQIIPKNLRFCGYSGENVP